MTNHCDFSQAPFHLEDQINTELNQQITIWGFAQLYEAVCSCTKLCETVLNSSFGASKTTKLGIVEVQIWNIAFNNKFDKHESLWSLQKKGNSEIIEIF